MFWQPEFESINRESLEKLQLERLKKTLAHAANSPYYGSLFTANGIDPEDFSDISQIRNLPLTTKADLRENYPYGLLTLPKDDLVRMHCSSGTTGNPTVVFHNRHDLDSWGNLVARSLYAAGARPGDVFQNICGYGLFTGGLGFQYGAECLGMLTIPAAAGNSRRQIKLIQDFGTTVVHAIPSYLTRLYDVFRELGVDPARDTDLKLLVIGAEPHSEETRQRIERMFGVKAYNSYGLTEMNGPGVAFECEHQTGLHVWEDSYVMEIIDPQTLEPLPDGEIGELVITTLDRQAMPILRYRTRDLTRIIPGECPCGRTAARRIDRIQGRSDDMFIIKGCNVFPIQIEKTLMEIPSVGNDYLITLETLEQNDLMTVEVEVARDFPVDDFAKFEALQKKITVKIRDEVLVTPKVKLVEPGVLPQAQGKAVRVCDKRKTK